MQDIQQLSLSLTQVGDDDDDKAACPLGTKLHVLLLLNKLVESRATVLTDNQVESTVIISFLNENVSRKIMKID